jgi:hypothetical protein
MWYQTPLAIRTLGISVLRNGTPPLFLENDIRHICWNWSIASFNCNCCYEDSSLKVTSKTTWMSGILINLEGPTERAEKCVDVKSAPHAKHTASRISWLHTRGPGVRIRKHASQFSLRLTKDENS